MEEEYKLFSIFKQNKFNSINKKKAKIKWLNRKSQSNEIKRKWKRVVKILFPYINWLLRAIQHTLF